MLLASEVHALVDASISPSLLALPVLEVILPLTLVAGSIHVDVYAVSIGFIVNPVALVDVAVNMYEFTVPMRSVVAPLSFVAGAIGPHLCTITISKAADPLPLVCRPGLERINRPLLSLSLWIVLLLRHSLAGFFHCEVFAVSLLFKNYLGVF